jgi:hypothetical protein
MIDHKLAELSRTAAPYRGGPQWSGRRYHGPTCFGGEPKAMRSPEQLESASQVC